MLVGMGFAGLTHAQALLFVVALRPSNIPDRARRVDPVQTLIVY